VETIFLGEVVTDSRTGDLNQVRSTLVTIGKIVGMGDHKPKYGRFVVV
jgi:hypothetical protein